MQPLYQFNIQKFIDKKEKDVMLSCTFSFFSFEFPTDSPWSKLLIQLVPQKGGVRKILSAYLLPKDKKQKIVYYC
jgi:hypothetical protein